MAQVEISVSHRGAERIAVNGTNIEGSVRAFTLTHAIDSPVPILRLDYVCLEGATYEGDALIIHQCPLEGTVDVAE